MAANATGEAQTGPLRLQFDRSVKLAFYGSIMSSDGCLLLHRELDDALGLTDLAAGLFADPRTGRNGRHRLISFLRESVFSRLGGYEAAHRPALCGFVGGSTRLRSSKSLGGWGSEELRSVLKSQMGKDGIDKWKRQ